MSYYKDKTHANFRWKCIVRLNACLKWNNTAVTFQLVKYLPFIFSLFLRFYNPEISRKINKKGIFFGSWVKTEINLWVAQLVKEQLTYFIKQILDPGVKKRVNSPSRSCCRSRQVPHRKTQFLSMNEKQKEPICQLYLSHLLSEGSCVACGISLELWWSRSLLQC